MESRKIVSKYWEVMNSNDFTAASKLLSEDFECHWPQSLEIIKGREKFIQINSTYPAQGRWKFKINQMVVEGNRVVTDVSVTDGKMLARAITFSTVEGEFIKKQVEYWPDNYPPPAWRKKWVDVNK
jgi:limonene-1,2-epoxide hydrolase